MVRCIPFAAFLVSAALGCGRSTTPSPPEASPADAAKSPSTPTESPDPSAASETNVSETKSSPVPAPAPQTPVAAEKPPRPASRTWTDASGKFKVEAELLQIKGDTVVLKTPNGNTTTVAISKLSKPDQDFVASVVKPAASVEGPPSQSHIPQRAKTATVPPAAEIVSGPWKVEVLRIEFAKFGGPVEISRQIMDATHFFVLYGNVYELVGNTPSEHIVISLRETCITATKSQSGFSGLPVFLSADDDKPLELHGIGMGLEFKPTEKTVTLNQIRGMLGVAGGADVKPGEIAHTAAAFVVPQGKGPQIAKDGVRLKVRGLAPGLTDLQLPPLTPTSVAP
jgi:hypothetical protein